MTKEILKKIEKVFQEKLQEKPTWGKNEVLKIYTEAVNEVLMEML